MIFLIGFFHDFFMDALHLREILLKVGKEIRCPLCNTPVSLHNIELIADNDLSQEDCDLNILCDHCQFKFGGRAKLLSVPLSGRKKFNESSLVSLEKSKTSYITKEEKENLKASLLKGFFSQSL